ncbi:hypothetical protein JOY44_19300 [Phormidium sp. CLA17]|uniref:hypothetical protein n=1 Tax=Leptolyngbya sp. Cla-17 TaxID=2803751 RepID=UPI0014921B37|nr:hypothetical protein [Leptolyngbya sp. Cla-17]MBM0743737.1 hypothetical protein [Leptolyngbya sp. Cla-17]
MKLEKEFQTHIHRQQMNIAHRVSAALQTQRSLPSSLSSSTWVKLHNPPTELCQDEALLLCQAASNQWVAWIPDHGKILLAAEDFSLE